jgi:predicted ATPase
MRISRIKLENWKNFKHADVELTTRTFVAGPNASGKSNFLDVFRFLRDIVADGFQKAVDENRGGVSKIRCLSARRYPDIMIEARISRQELINENEDWRYRISFKQDNQAVPFIVSEKVWHGNALVLSRPDQNDKNDKDLLRQTALEQLAANREFREVAEFFRTISYRHLVPQIIKNPQMYQITKVGHDPFGSDFLEQLATTTEKTRIARLKKIETALKTAVPQLNDLEMEKDQRGIPHLVGRYTHWRPGGAIQREEQFSDGTLRLVGLLWSLLDGDGPLLLEEPELSLHPAVIKRLAPIIHKLQKKKSGARQVIVSTHSPELLSNPGIGGEETLLLIPGTEGTEIKIASSINEVRVLLEAGMTVAEAALPLTEPENILQLELFS